MNIKQVYFKDFCALSEITAIFLKTYKKCLSQEIISNRTFNRFPLLRLMVTTLSSKPKISKLKLTLLCSSYLKAPTTPTTTTISSSSPNSLPLVQIHSNSRNNNFKPMLSTTMQTKLNSTNSLLKQIRKTISARINIRINKLTVRLVLTNGAINLK